MDSPESDRSVDLMNIAVEAREHLAAGGEVMLMNPSTGERRSVVASPLAHEFLVVDSINSVVD